MTHDDRYDENGMLKGDPYDLKNVRKAMSEIVRHSEWWTPTRDWLLHANAYPLHLRESMITAIGKDLFKGLEETEPTIGIWIGSRGTFSLGYDTPEHRDEDFERLKLALGVK